MSNKLRGVNTSGLANMVKISSPVEQVEEFLIGKGYYIHVNFSSKQVWRSKLLYRISRLLGVNITPAVYEIPEASSKLTN